MGIELSSFVRNGEQQQFQIAFDMAPAPALMLDCDLRILACNAAYERCAHINRAAMLGRNVLDVFPGSDDRQSMLARGSFDRVAKTLKPHHIPHVRYAITGPDGTGLDERHWAISNFPLLLDDGTLSGILHCPTDITELTVLRQANQSIQDSGLDQIAKDDIQRWTRSVQDMLQSEKERLRQLFQQAPGFICVLKGPEHIFEMANDAYHQLIGHLDIVGLRVVDVLPELVAQGIMDKLDAVYKTGVPFIGRAMPVEFQGIVDGSLEQRYLDFIYQPIRDDAGKVTGIFTQGNDVTEAFTLAQHVTYQAAHDSLTGLYNRREFNRQTQTGEKQGSHALLYMDLDQFKIVNDRCGHAAGDQLLIKVATALQSRCEQDDLLARLGGDEFALVRRNCSQEDAVALANRLREAVKETDFVWQGQRYGVTLSIGVVNFGDEEGLAFESALGLADAACFLAKEKGRNRVQVSLATDEEVRRQQSDMDNVTRLKEAMREDRVILHTQRIVGLQPGQDQPQSFYEVLARLTDSDGTMINPSGFIPAAERFGMIEDLDHHIVCKTFAHLQAQASRQQDQACYFVNLSSITLSAPGFQSLIENAFAKYPAVRSSQICFEVTETAAMSNIDRTAEAMRGLIDMGFRFALDDFGSGMASFAYLSRLPVQFVKIDGEFVKAILDRPANGVIVEAVAKVARAMNMQTIAESVEYEELIPHLKSMGIDYAQGYALQHPVPI